MAILLGLDEKSHALCLPSNQQARGSVAVSIDVLTLQSQLLLKDWQATGESGESAIKGVAFE